MSNRLRSKADFEIYSEFAEEGACVDWYTCASTSLHRLPLSHRT